MEQVFELVNTIVGRDRDTRRRNLRIRDYKVIPLAPQAGVLEFVGNTTPLRKWLHHAHARYVITMIHPSHCKGSNFPMLDIDLTTLSRTTSSR